MRARPLHERALSYDAVGATSSSRSLRSAAGRGYRAYDSSVRIGVGPDCWSSASYEVVRWGVKTRSGFTVSGGSGPGAVVEEGADYWLVAHLGPWRVREPVRVVQVVNEPQRVGFSYGTLTGHPVSGEEAFEVTCSSDGTVFLTLRSLTRPAAGPWRPAFPALLVTQRAYRRRYRRALS